MNESLRAIVKMASVFFTIVAVVATVIRMATGNEIPALAPFCFALVMVGLLFILKWKYDDFDMSKGYAIFYGFIVTLFFIGNIIVGVLQIMAAVRGV